MRAPETADHGRPLRRASPRSDFQSSSDASTSRATPTARERAAALLSGRALASGIEPLILSPRTDDFNGDLRALGIEGLRRALR
jgi:hypothetical protein